MSRCRYSKVNAFRDQRGQGGLGLGDKFLGSILGREKIASMLPSLLLGGCDEHFKRCVYGFRTLPYA